MPIRPPITRSQLDISDTNVPLATAIDQLSVENQAFLDNPSNTNARNAVLRFVAARMAVAQLRGQPMSQEQINTLINETATSARTGYDGQPTVNHWNSEANSVLAGQPVVDDQGRILPNYHYEMGSYNIGIESGIGPANYRLVENLSPPPLNLPSEPPPPAPDHVAGIWVGDHNRITIGNNGPGAPATANQNGGAIGYMNGTPQHYIAGRETEYHQKDMIPIWLGVEGGNGHRGTVPASQRTNYDITVAGTSSAVLNPSQQGNELLGGNQGVTLNIHAPAGSTEQPHLHIDTTGQGVAGRVRIFENRTYQGSTSTWTEIQYTLDSGQVQRYFVPSNVHVTVGSRTGNQSRYNEMEVAAFNNQQQLSSNAGNGVVTAQAATMGTAAPAMTSTEVFRASAGQSALNAAGAGNRLVDLTNVSVPNYTINTSSGQSLNLQSVFAEAGNNPNRHIFHLNMAGGGNGLTQINNIDELMSLNFQNQGNNTTRISMTRGGRQYEVDFSGTGGSQMQYVFNGRALSQQDVLNLQAARRQAIGQGMGPLLTQNTNSTLPVVQNREQQPSFT
jgi:hypothetical protein